MKDDYTTNFDYVTYAFLFKRLRECTLNLVIDKHRRDVYFTGKIRSNLEACSTYKTTARSSSANWNHSPLDTKINSLSRSIIYSWNEEILGVPRHTVDDFDAILMMRRVVFSQSVEWLAIVFSFTDFFQGMSVVLGYFLKNGMKTSVE